MKVNWNHKILASSINFKPENINGYFLDASYCGRPFRVGGFKDKQNVLPFPEDHAPSISNWEPL